MSNKIGCISQLTTITGSVWSGIVLTQLWAWFVVPQFHLPQIGIGVAIGLCVTVRLLTYQGLSLGVDDLERLGDIQHISDVTKRIERGAFFVALYSTLIVPTSALIFGWIVHFIVTLPPA